MLKYRIYLKAMNLIENFANKVSGIDFLSEDKATWEFSGSGSIAVSSKGVQKGVYKLKDILSTDKVSVDQLKEYTGFVYRELSNVMGEPLESITINGSISINAPNGKVSILSYEDVARMLGINKMEHWKRTSDMDLFGKPSPSIVSDLINSGFEELYSCDVNVRAKDSSLNTVLDRSGSKKYDKYCILKSNRNEILCINYNSKNKNECKGSAFLFAGSEREGDGIPYIEGWNGSCIAIQKFFTGVNELRVILCSMNSIYNLRSSNFSDKIFKKNFPSFIIMGSSSMLEDLAGCIREGDGGGPYYVLMQDAYSSYEISMALRWYVWERIFRSGKCKLKTEFTLEDISNEKIKSLRDLEKIYGRQDVEEIYEKCCSVINCAMFGGDCVV